MKTNCCIWDRVEGQKILSNRELEGDAADAIINAASRLGSDLIIGGTHAWSGIDKAIVGSIMESVIVNAPCPVLVVK